MKAGRFLFVIFGIVGVMILFSTVDDYSFAEKKKVADEDEAYSIGYMAGVGLAKGVITTPEGFEGTGIYSICAKLALESLDEYDYYQLRGAGGYFRDGCIAGYTKEKEGE